MRIVRADVLRQVCKEPLSEVRSLNLQGRGVEQLEGLELCPSLTSLNVSCNALTGLDEKCFAQCQEVWVIDAAHNQLEFIGGLSSFLAIGYLDLSYNVDLSLEHLRPLARAHLLELYLGGDDRLASDRPCILRVVPNVWVLNGEYVTAHERRLAERSGKCNDDTELPPWYTGTKIRESGCEPLDETDGPSESRSFWEKEQTEGEREVGGTQHQSEMFSAFYPEYRDMSRQGRLAREFFEDVVWKLPCRSEAADPIRLCTLLERYDRRVAGANRSAWLGSFTTAHGLVPTRVDGVGGANGAGDRSQFLPMSHATVLRSLPLDSKLDLAVILAIRAAFRDTMPQQILEEALMVLLIHQGGVPERIHGDLSRVPPFICTALVHVLREDIIREVKKVSAPGCANTTSPPLLDRAHSDLLAALPPVVTGIGDVFEHWETLQMAHENGKTVAAADQDAVGKPSPDQKKFVCMPFTNYASDPSIGTINDHNSMTRSERSSSHTSAKLEGEDSTSRMLFGSEGPSSVLSSEDVTGAEHDAGRLQGGIKETNSATSRTPAELLSTKRPRIEGAEVPNEGSIASHDDGIVHKSRGRLREGVGLMRLCRKAVILLTRSPACPDLVERQTGSADQRTYDQIEPLLAKAGMSYRDLHPARAPVHGERGMSSARARGSTNAVAHDTTAPGYSISSDASHHSLASWTPSRGSDLEDRVQEEGEHHWAEEVSAEASWSNEAARCNTKIRRPEVAENVQVLHETWSVIVAVCPDGSSVSVSPFQGMENPPHMGDRRLDSRCLYYDPRGWWNHVHALRQQNNVPAAIGRDLMRLYRPYRGISASGLQSGTGCLNVPLLICGPEDELPESRCRAGVDINPQTVPSSCRLDAKGLPGDADSVPSNRHSRSPPSSHCHAGPFSGRCGAPRPLNVFRAECCWDPVFVVAPARLVGLQNQAAAREMGLKRARLAAWQHIDGPEVSVAPRPIMSHCRTPTPPSHAMDPPALLRSASIPGLGTASWPILGIPSGSSRKIASASTCGSLRAPYNGLCRSSSLPGASYISEDAEKTDGGNHNPWLDLQREMGSLKADNQLGLSCHSGGSSGGGDTVHGLTHPQGSALLKKSSSVAESADQQITAEVAALANTLSLRLDLPVSPWEPSPGAIARRQTTNDKSTVFQLTQLSVDSEGDTNAISSKSNEGNSGTELPEPNEISSKADPRAQRSTETPNTLPERGLWERWQNRRRSRDSRSRSESDTATWRPNSRRALEWFPVPGRTIFRVDPSHVAAAAAAATVVGDRKSKGDGADSGERGPDGESKERGPGDSRTDKHLAHFSEDVLGVTALSSRIPARLSTLLGSRSHGKESGAGDPATVWLPSARDAVSEIGKSTISRSSSRINLPTKMGWSRTKGVNPTCGGISTSPKSSRGNAWSTTAEDGLIGIKQQWGTGTALSPVSAISAGGWSCTPGLVAQRIESSIRSNDTPSDKLSRKLRPRRREPSGSRSDSRGRHGETGAMGGGATNEQTKAHPSGCPSSRSGAMESIAVHGRLPPYNGRSHSNNRRRSSAGNGRNRTKQGNRSSGGARRSMNLDARNGVLTATAKNLTDLQKDTRKTLSDADSIASAHLECLSISSGSCAGWSAGGRNCGV